jgi:hypothetical protein
MLTSATASVAQSEVVLDIRYDVSGFGSCDGDASYGATEIDLGFELDVAGGRRVVDASNGRTVHFDAFR